MTTPPMDARGLAALATRYGMPTDALVPLARVVVQSNLELTLEPEAVLCGQNEMADALYFLLDGTLRVQRRNRLNEMEDIATAAAPAVLGHMALVLHKRRSAALVAGPEGARVVSLPLEQVEWLLKGTLPESDALRRLMLAAQLDQHHRAVVDILRILNPDTPLPSGWSAT
jgi:CRP-like cAMP-binding protein